VRHDEPTGYRDFRPFKLTGKTMRNHGIRCTRFVYIKIERIHLNILIEVNVDLTSKMVSLPDVLASNAQITSILPKHLIAVFAGATSGIGETTLKKLIKYAVEPRIYLFARNPTSAARIIAECQHINPRGEYIFVKVDLSSIKETDRACAEAMIREKQINLVVLSAGEARFDRCCRS
jgi:hypothetical protein